MPSEAVLILDPDAAVRRALSSALVADGWEVREAATLQDALSALGAGLRGLVIADMERLGLSGPEFVGLLKAPDRGLGVDVLLMAESPDLGSVVSARDAGALDMCRKPLDIEDVRARVRQAFAMRSHRSVARAAPSGGARAADGQPTTTAEEPGAEAGEDAPPGVQLVGGSEDMVVVYRLVADCAKGDMFVLIAGEMGTGKKRIARCIHERSSRAAGPFTVLAVETMSEQARAGVHRCVRSASSASAPRIRRGGFAVTLKGLALARIISSPVS